MCNHLSRYPAVAGSTPEVARVFAPFPRSGKTGYRSNDTAMRNQSLLDGYYPQGAPAFIGNYSMNRIPEIPLITLIQSEAVDPAQKTASRCCGYRDDKPALGPLGADGSAEVKWTYSFHARSRLTKMLLFPIVKLLWNGYMRVGIQATGGPLMNSGW
jgi:hypothetical protein